MKVEGGEFESFHPVLSVLSYLLKAPMVPQGTPVVNALFRQKLCLENIFRLERQSLLLIAKLQVASVTYMSNVNSCKIDKIQLCYRGTYIYIYIYIYIIRLCGLKLNVSVYPAFCLQYIYELLLCLCSIQLLTQCKCNYKII